MSATKLALEQEHARRRAAALAAFTPEAVADGHKHQLSALLSKAQNLILMCSRRAGKSYLCCALLAMTAVHAPGAASCLYLALTKGQATKIWRKIWKPLCRKWKLCTSKDHNETELTTTLPNGATVQFGGTDDLRHVQSLLGESMACGMAIIDECQSDPGLIEALVTDILGPMLDETTQNLPVPGRLVLAGTVPAVASGYFWETWIRSYDEDKEEVKADSAWHAIGWGRADNPHETYFNERLDSYCSKYGLLRSDPIVQRNWYGKRVFDTNATAFKYSRDKNGWRWTADDAAKEDAFQPGILKQAKVPPGLDTFAIGLDPAASSDRFAIVLWAWASSNPVGVWHIGEWATERAANALESQYLAVVESWVKKYNVVSIIWDPGGASTTKDPAFLSEYKLVIEPAKKGKGSKKARVDRLKDLLGTGRAHIMIGSALEDDLAKAMFDPEKRAIGKYEWTAACHPDVADAATYALPAYIEAIKKEPRQRQNPMQAVGTDEDERLAREAWTKKPVVYGLQEEVEQFDDGTSSYGGPGMDNNGPVL